MQAFICRAIIQEPDEQGSETNSRISPHFPPQPFTLHCLELSIIFYLVYLLDLPLKILELKLLVRDNLMPQSRKSLII